MKNTIYGKHIEKCESYIKEIVELALKLKDKQRPCEFFHYTGLMRERIMDCESILTRMDVRRRRLLLLDKQLHVMRAKTARIVPGVPLPEEMQVIMRTENKISRELRMDFESLYLFGMMLLDQWALVAKCIAGISIAKRHPFNEIVELYESSKGGQLKTLLNNTAGQLLWLYHNFRVFRNVFVAHPVQSWQRGVTRGISGMDFRLFIPAPPGHRIEKRTLNKEMESMIRLVPQYIHINRNHGEHLNPREILQVLIEGIGAIPQKEDRLQIEGLYKRYGGSTPTYQTVGTKLIQFCAEGLKEFVDMLKGSPNTLNLDYIGTTTSSAR